MMNAVKLATSIVVFSTFGICQAQEAMPLMPLQKTAVVAAQTSSPANYALLKPISTTPAPSPMGLLKPINAKTSPATTEEDKIVVTPHSFKRGVFDEHEFKVYNASSRTLRDAKIAFKAPIGSVVQQVSPKPDSVDGLSIILTVGEIAPGDHEIVEVTINYPRDEFAKFDSIVIAENWGLVASAVPSSATTESDSGLATNMLQPRQSGMLTPKLPAKTVSATTRRYIIDKEVSTKATDLEPNFEEAPSNVEVPDVETTKPSSSVKSYFHGPRDVAAGSEVQFSIDVQNLTSEDAEGIIVQLSVPENMKVTILDREAWYDGATRKISWQLAKLEGRAVETIRYKARVKKACTIEQSLVVGMSNQVLGSNRLTTVAK